jgi:hypothetical protein
MGFSKIARVHGAFGLARADHGVQFVDEQNDLAVRIEHFFEHGLEALFEFAAELGAGDQRAHVERDDAFFFEAFGDVAAHDALRETFHNGGLADAGLADQHRIVLGAARENLDDAADFFIAADDRVELARRRSSSDRGRIFPGLRRCLRDSCW